MTATTAAPTATAPATARGIARLGALLRADAALCALTGLVGAVAARPVADLLGPDVPAGVVRVVGLALVVYALDLALVSRARLRWLRPAALVAGLGSLAWAIATIALVVAGAFSLVGAVVALALAAVVGWLGLLQLRATR